MIIELFSKFVPASPVPCGKAQRSGFGAIKEKGRRGYEVSRGEGNEMERVAFDVGAGGRIRTPDLLITNQLLYRLSYTSTSTGDDYHNKPGRVCQQIYRPEEAFFSPEISFLHKERRYDPCGDGGGIPGRRAAPQSARGGADKSLRNGKTFGDGEDYPAAQDMYTQYHGAGPYGDRQVSEKLLREEQR